MKHRIFALSFLLLTACLFQLLLAQAANPYQATISEFEALDRMDDWKRKP